MATLLDRGPSSLIGLVSVLALHVFVDGLVDDLPGAPMLGPGPRVALARRPCQLALELPVAGEPVLVEPAVGERRADRAAGLALVAAVAEAARRRDVGDVVEGGLDALVGAEDLERPDPGRVDEQRSAGQLEQLAMGRRVAAARVRSADLGRRLAVLAEQRVDERRLADAGRAEDRRRRAGPQVGAQVVEPGAGPRRDRRRSRRPGAMASTATSRPSTSSARSALLRTTTGVISLDQATAR